MSGGLYCALCGAPARAPFHAPQPEIGPDLDMRPGEPARSTLRDWLQTCGGCGAVAPDLSALPAAARATVDSPDYRALANEGSEETLPFRRWAAVCRAIGDQPAAAEAMLHAAWAADDAADMMEVMRLRQEVARAWGEPEDELTALRLLDVLRRTSHFEDAEAWAGKLSGRKLGDAGRAVLAFQRSRIQERDITRHLLSSALPEGMSVEALPRPPFWAWLFRA